MSFNDIYVGELDDPTFCWEGGDRSGNIPKRRSPFFPDSNPNEFRNWIKKAGITAKQTDWSAWVAKVTKAQITEFIAHCYDSNPSYNDPQQMLVWEGKAYQVEKLNKLREFVRCLDDHRVYALVLAPTD